MADTPRVTVPVKGQSFAHEQEWINRASRVLTAHPDYNNTEHGETNGWRGNHFTALCFDQAGNRMRCGADFKRATKEATYPVWWVWPDQIAAMLSAAPAPEGGAVLEDALDAWIVEGMKKADQCIAEITPVGCSGMTPEDVETGRVSAYKTGFQNGVKSTLTDAAFVIMNAALATREEAPAEAGEDLVSAIDAFMPSAEVAFLWTKETPPPDEVQRYRERYWAVKEALLRLRAQPPAREDAQPVAYRVWCQSDQPHKGGWWSLVEQHDGDHAIATGGGKNLQPLYTTPPEPEVGKLRVAVEALEKIKAGVVEVFDDELQCNVEVTMDGEEASDIASQALAALQAEQGAK